MVVDLQTSLLFLIFLGVLEEELFGEEKDTDLKQPLREGQDSQEEPLDGLLRKILR